MKQDSIKVGLVGAGVFGGYHANKLTTLERVEFVGVFDPDIARSSDLAKKHDVSAFPKAEALFAECEAVVIACPAIYHGEMAIAALKAELHVLVEKPIATNVVDADTIVGLAKDKNRIVQVGHQERFVIRAIGLDNVSETPENIIAIRNTPYSIRGTDTSVTLDLMSHDIDVCCMLMKETPETVTGSSESVKSDTPDRARAELNFEKGSAILSASRVEDAVTRQMTLKYPSGTVIIDFVAKTLQHNTPFDLNADFGSDASAADSLGAATQSFISAILNATPVSVSAQDGLNAARIALQIDGEA